MEIINKYRINIGKHTIIIIIIFILFIYYYNIIINPILFIFMIIIILVWFIIGSISGSLFYISFIIIRLLNDWKIIWIIDENHKIEGLSIL